jgi:ribosomal protein L21E
VPTCRLLTPSNVSVTLTHAQPPIHPLLETRLDPIHSSAWKERSPKSASCLTSTAAGKRPTARIKNLDPSPVMVLGALTFSFGIASTTRGLMVMIAAVDGQENRELARKERPTMIREGDRVRVLPREKSPPSKKYAGQTGVVTTTSPSAYGTLLFVQMDGNPDDVDTGFREDDLEEVWEWEDSSS